MRNLSGSRPLITLLLLFLMLWTLPVLAQGETVPYISSDGALSFTYPSGWILDESNASFGIILANNQAAMETIRSGSDTMSSGGMAVLVLPAATNVLSVSTGEMSQMSPIDVAIAMGEDLVSSAPDSSQASFEPPTPMVLGGHDGAHMKAFSTDVNTEVWVYVADMGEDMGVVVALANMGEVAPNEPALLNLAASLQVSAVQPTAAPPLKPASGELTYNSTISGELFDSEGESWTLSGQQGDAITISVTSVNDMALELLDASGMSLISDDDGGGSLNPLINEYVLPASGTYTVHVTSYDASGGQYELTLDKVVIVPANPIEFGQTVSGKLTQPGGDRWSFGGTRGMIVSIDMASDFDNALELRDKNGTVLFENDDGAEGTNAAISSFLLEADGAYTIVARTYDRSSTGETPFPYTLTLNRVILPIPGKVAYGDFASTALISSEGDRWTFDGKQGDTVMIAALGAFDTVLELYGPDQSLLMTNDDGLDGLNALIDGFTLPASGEYAVLVRGSYDSDRGRYALMIGRAAQHLEMVGSK